MLNCLQRAVVRLRVPVIRSPTAFMAAMAHLGRLFLSLQPGNLVRSLFQLVAKFFDLDRQGATLLQSACGISPMGHPCRAAQAVPGELSKLSRKTRRSYMSLPYEAAWNLTSR